LSSISSPIHIEGFMNELIKKLVEAYGPSGFEMGDKGLEPALLVVNLQSPFILRDS